MQIGKHSGWFCFGVQPYRCDFNAYSVWYFKRILAGINAFFSPFRQSAIFSLDQEKEGNRKAALSKRKAKTTDKTAISTGG